MPLTMEQLQELLDGENLKYYVDPKKPVYLLGFTGLFGSYQVLATIQVDGEFFQLRTLRYSSCPKDHSALAEVHKAMAGLNYDHRLVKFAWDERDGEISATGDHWVMETSLTQPQIHRLLGNFLPTIDTAYERLRRTIETGTDPGPIGKEEIAKRVASQKPKPDSGAATSNPKKITEI